MRNITIKITDIFLKHFGAKQGIEVDEKITGGCYCGQVRYELHAPPLAMGFCHCHSCQKIAGGAYYAWVAVSKDAITFNGEIKDFTSIGGSGGAVIRSFCANCGTRISSRGEWLNDRMTVSAGSLDNPDLFKPEMHTWTKEARAWDCMDLSIPAFEQGRTR